MDQHECLAAIESGESAYGLLLEHAPHVEKKFNRLCKSMRRLLDEVRVTFPDAEYYTGGGGFSLMLGKSHADDLSCSDQRELTALVGRGVEVGDGDF